MLLYVNPLSAPQAIQPGVNATGSGREQKALKELEHYFAFTLLQEMRKSVPKSGFLDGGQAQQMYEEMFDDAVSGKMSETGQLGISRMLEQQLRIADLQQKVHAAGTSAKATPVSSNSAAINTLK